MKGKGVTSARPASKLLQCYAYLYVIPLLALPDRSPLSRINLSPGMPQAQPLKPSLPHRSGMPKGHLLCHPSRVSRLMSHQVSSQSLKSQESSLACQRVILCHPLCQLIHRTWSSSIVHGLKQAQLGALTTQLAPSHPPHRAWAEAQGSEDS